jgi:hypothetical protein
MPINPIAIASAKSFGDFVIVHSMLHRVEESAKANIRLIACSHLRALNEILPQDVAVTVMDSGENRVPAVFDIKKCGAIAAAKSALSLRRRLQRIERKNDELLAFDVLGARERFIAGRWPLVGPKSTASNIYGTYARFLCDQEIPTRAAPSATAETARLVGIFPESRLAKKRLASPTLSVIVDRAATAQLDAKIFVLDGDRTVDRTRPGVIGISRNFESLAAAIRSVDFVISADSLPAHLAEYFNRPVFVASPFPNEYWLPHGCFTHQRWGIFANKARFSAALDRFFVESRKI